MLDNSILWVVLAVAILFVFLYEWRVIIISVVAIPLSLMAGALVLYFQEATLNTMILAGVISITATGVIWRMWRPIRDFRA